MKTAEAAEEEDERRSAVAIGSARSSTASHKPKEKENAVAGRQWAVNVAIISGEIVRRVEDCRSGKGGRRTAVGSGNRFDEKQHNKS